MEQDFCGTNENLHLVISKQTGDAYVLSINGQVIQEFEYLYFDYTNKMARADVYGSVSDKRIKFTLLERWDLVS